MLSLGGAKYQAVILQRERLEPDDVEGGISRLIGLTGRAILPIITGVRRAKSRPVISPDVSALFAAPFLLEPTR